LRTVNGKEEGKIKKEKLGGSVYEKIQSHLLVTRDGSTKVKRALEKKKRRKKKRGRQMQENK